MRGDSRHHSSSAIRRFVTRVRAQDGFTLIEILASALIVVLIAAAVAQGLISGGHMSGFQLARSQADEVAQQDQERLRSLSAKQLTNLSQAQTSTVSLGGTRYTVSSQATSLGTGGSTSCATAGSSAIAYFHTVSSVSWTDTNGTHSLSEDSLITPPVDGSLLTPVVDQTGAALSGINVMATGQSSGGDVEGGTTDSNGCVIFTGLQPDTYSLSFTGTGYVDKDGHSPVTDSATVTTSGTARPTNSQETMGLAGLAKASSFSTKSYTSDTNTTVTTVPNQLAGGLSWYGAGSSLSMSAYQANDATSTTGDASISTDPLFPFAFAGPPVNYTNNYQLWTGQCRGEQPPSAFTTNAVSVSPGTTQSIPVWEPAVILKVNYAGSRVAPGDVHMTYSSTSPSCTDEWIETIRGTAPNYTLATTSKLGVLAYTGVPYASSSTSGTTASASGIAGTETFCADYYTGSTYGWRQASASPASLSMTTPTAVTINITSSSTAGQCP